MFKSQPTFSQKYNLLAVPWSSIRSNNIIGSAFFSEAQPDLDMLNQHDPSSSTRESARYSRLVGDDPGRYGLK